MTSSDKDLQDFQQKVFAEYKTAKSLKASVEKIKKDRENNRKGCLSVPKLMFVEWVIDKAFKSASRQKNYAANESEAEELLEQKEILARICAMIADTNRAEILTEEKFVHKLTAVLYRSDLTKKFVIPENAVLYAMMATEIFNVGLEEFCNDLRADE